MSMKTLAEVSKAMNDFLSKPDVKERYQIENPDIRPENVARISSDQAHPSLQSEQVWAARWDRMFLSATYSESCGEICVSIM